MLQQKWLHPPVPAKTQCRTNGPESCVRPVAFSILNFEEYPISPLSNQPLNTISISVGGRDFIFTQKALGPDR